MHFFSEHRLIFRNIRDFPGGSVRVNARRAPQRVRQQQIRSFNTKKGSDLKTLNSSGRLVNLGQQSQKSVIQFRRAKTTDRLRNLQRSDFASDKDFQAERLKLQQSSDKLKSIYNTGSSRGSRFGFISSSNSQKRSQARKDRFDLFDAQSQSRKEQNKRMQGRGGFDKATMEFLEQERFANFLQEESIKQNEFASKRQQIAERRSGIKGKVRPRVATASTVGQGVIDRAGDRISGRVTPDGLKRSERLGLERKVNQRRQKRLDDLSADISPDEQGNFQRGGSPYRNTQSPYITQPAEVPTDVYGTQTGRQSEAAGALDGDTIDAPDSLGNIRREEIEAIEPTLAALGIIRNSYKIYQRGQEELIDQRGQQIHEYKKDSQERARQITDLKIQQSKDNRDYELELIEESRDRSRRDEMLAQEKIDREFDREEERIIKENTERIDRLNTSLGARYGGFGSGAGLKKIDTARQDGEKVLREITEDKIHARREHVNALDTIESKWKLDRKGIFNAHDNSVTEAYTNLLGAAQAIDDNALDEEGDKLDDAAQLLRESFDQLNKVWTDTGNALSQANQRALDRRDALRKEQYDKEQDSIKNLFSAADRFSVSSPLFDQMEESAGFVPGTLKTTSTYEERRMLIAEQNLMNQNKRLRADMARAEREGNGIDKTKSEALGYLVTQDGGVFRDSFGHPVFLADQGGTFSGNSEHDRMLFGNDSVSMHSAASFKNYALGIGDVVPGSPYHRGGEYDIDGRAGDPVPAWTSGTVVEVGTIGDGVNEGYGNYVDVSDGRNTIRYAHLQDVFVKPGQQIQGKASGSNVVLGTIGNTGNTLDINGNPPAQGDHEAGSHLHLEARDKDGNLVDLMDIGVQSGVAQSGKISWVDDQRSRFRGDSTTSWAEIDQAIYNEALNAFKDDDGKTNWKAVDMVRDYLNDTKKGDYFVSEDGNVQSKASQKVRQRSAERLAIDNEIVLHVKTMIAGGADPFDAFYAIQGETDTYGDTITIDDVDAAEYLLRAGYRVENKFDFGTGFRDVSRSLTPTEKELLNEERRQQGLPEIE